MCLLPVPGYSQVSLNCVSSLLRAVSVVNLKGTLGKEASQGLSNGLELKNKSKKILRTVFLVDGEGGV